MEMQPPKRLSDVLRRHAEGGHLREAFDRVNAMRDTRTYDRTTLPRWLSGESTPSDEKFIGRLAGELGDPEIVSAWVDDRCGTNREVRDLLTQFRGLSSNHKRDVQALINESFRDNPATRTAFTMRIELHGGALTPDFHRLDLRLGWVGRLPAKASVEIAPDEEGLVQAYTRGECIFRELVPSGSDALATAMAAFTADCRPSAISPLTAIPLNRQQSRKAMKASESINLTTKRFPPRKSGSSRACPIQQTCRCTPSCSELTRWPGVPRSRWSPIRSALGGRTPCAFLARPGHGSAQTASMGGNCPSRSAKTTLL